MIVDLLMACVVNHNMIIENEVDENLELAQQDHDPL
jgi:hypothetical protein